MLLRAPFLNVEWFCYRSVITFNKSVKNMLSINSLVEIKGPAAVACPLVSVAICALAVYSYRNRLGGL